MLTSGQISIYRVISRGVLSLAAHINSTDDISSKECSFTLICPRGNKPFIELADNNIRMNITPDAVTMWTISGPRETVTFSMCAPTSIEDVILADKYAPRVETLLSLAISTLKK